MFANRHIQDGGDSVSIGLNCQFQVRTCALYHYPGILHGTVLRVVHNHFYGPKNGRPQKKGSNDQKKKDE